MLIPHFDLYSEPQYKYLPKNARKTRNQQTKHPSQLSETLNEFVIGSNENVGAIGNQTLGPQTDGHHKDPEKIVDGEISACQNQVTGKNVDDKIIKAVDNAVMSFKNPMHDALLTTMDNVVILRVEMAVRSITRSSRHGPNRADQNRGRRDFTENTENSPPMSASSRLDVNIDQNRIDET